MATNKLKHRYVQIFGIIVIIMALVRCVFPEVAKPFVAESVVEEPVVEESVAEESVVEPIVAEKTVAAPIAVEQQQDPSIWQWNDPKIDYHTGDKRPHRIRSVANYSDAFPDINDVQLTAALRLGVSPVKNRQNAEQRRNELVYIGSSPYYSLDALRQSIPYLVPRAALLLDDIGRSFFDSLQVKGVPLHRFIVTSVLRTQNDVERLRKVNVNATENSCHLYGTTFDITYINYKTVEDPDGPHRRLVRDDTLKFVLSEVLRDMRQQGRCYVKYERKQSCFHITVR